MRMLRDLWAAWRRFSMRPRGAFGLFVFQCVNGAVLTLIAYVQEQALELYIVLACAGVGATALNWLLAEHGAYRPRVYVAGAVESWGLCRGIMQRLRANGCQITHDWTEEIFNNKYDPDKPVPTHDSRAMAATDLQGVLDADVLVLVAPAARGSHTEFGAALGLGRPVVLVTANGADLDAKGRPCVFYAHPNVLKCDSESAWLPPAAYIVDAVLTAWRKG